MQFSAACAKIDNNIKVCAPEKSASNSPKNMPFYVAKA